MKHKYFYLFLITLACFGMMQSVSSKAFALLPQNMIDTAKKVVKSAIVDTRDDRPQGIKLTYKPFTPLAITYKNDPENGRVLNNVKVFPNPASDQINLAFKLNRDMKVTIKIMDALGNEITTLLSQRLSAGDQSHGFMLNGKLNSGYYFIRILAGTETIVKRVQVL